MVKVYSAFGVFVMAILLPFGLVYAQELPSAKPSVNVQEGIEKVQGESDDLYLMQKDIVIEERVKDNAYLAGINVAMIKGVGGNFWVISKDVQTGGRIGQSAYIVGFNVDVNEEINRDAFIIGKKVNIRSAVEGNVNIIAEDLFVDATLGDDVNIIASRVILNKAIKEDLKIKADEVYINSDQIRGDLEIDANKLYITDNIDIQGNFLVNNKQVEDIKDFSKYGLYDYASTGIPTDFEKLPRQGMSEYLGIAKLQNLAYVGYVLFTLMVILGDMLAGYIVFKLFPQKSSQVLENLEFSFKSLRYNVVVGLIFSMLASTITLISFFSLIGLPVFYIVLLSGLLIIQLSKYFAIYKIGDALVKKIQPGVKSLFIRLIVGELSILFLLLLFALIPVVGDLLVIIYAILFSLWALGGLVRVKLEAVKLAYFDRK